MSNRGKRRRGSAASLYAGFSLSVRRKKSYISVLIYSSKSSAEPSVDPVRRCCASKLMDLMSELHGAESFSVIIFSSSRPTFSRISGAWKLV